MNSFDRCHPFLYEERREALVSFPNATNLEIKYCFLYYDFAETTIIKVRHDAKLTGSALPDIQDRINQLLSVMKLLKNKMYLYLFSQKEL
ncbi:hypothetical protein M9Y10_010150 [Tritrichomonas musculus]|uniref:Uncharacterized protein n=1 Tax=Tritrichomonas musculus TaxID=1915356 RepID=A0ABR2IRH8_9EUKA